MKNILFILVSHLLLVLSCTPPVKPAPPVVAVAPLPPPVLTVTTQPVSVSSQPVGATVSINGKVVGSTPCCIILEKNRPHMILIAKDGYQPETVMIARKLNEKRLYLDMTISCFNKEGDVSGQTVKDAYTAFEQNELTGKAYDLEPAEIAVTLQKSGM